MDPMPGNRPGARERIAIIGGDAAGMSAASLIARRHGDAVSVSVFERSSVVSYAACGLPYHVSGEIDDATTLLVREHEHFTRQGIDLHLGQEVVDLDPGEGVLTTEDTSTGSRCDHAFDKVLIATGARARVPRIPGTDAPNVFSIRHYDDGVALADHVEAAGPLHATVVGAGYLGLEMAEALTTRGLAVTLVEAASQVFPGLDPDLSTLIVDELWAHDVDLFLDNPLQAIELDDDGRACAIHLKEHTLATDVVVLALGSEPVVELAERAGVALDATGAIAVDRSMRTNLDNVWAAGDCASTHHRVTSDRAWVPLGPTANKQGRVAGAAMMGEPAAFAGVVGTSLVKVFDLHVGRTGLNEAEARRHDLDPIATTITSDDIAHYYPGSKPTTIQLIADRAHRLLGAQVVGRSGVAGRVNVLATALSAGMTIDDVAELDLGYAPPFAPVWDPVLVAANKAIAAREQTHS